MPTPITPLAPTLTPRSMPLDVEAGYKRIFKSTALIGGASVAAVLIGIVRTKLIALLLGPAGIGLIGLLTALMTTAATVAQFGLSTVGTRQIAEADGAGDLVRLDRARQALVWATLALAAAGALTVLLLREPLASLAVGDATSANTIGLLAIGVALAVMTAAQTALVRGMRRMRDMAAITIIGALSATGLGVPLIWAFGADGIVAYVLLGPLTAWLAGLWFVARLPRPGTGALTLAELARRWGVLLRLGLPFMAASLMAIGVELWLRIDVRQQLGLAALGHFQAAWVVAATYVGFVLGAMGADYYPRLTTAIARPPEAVAIVNQQTEVALLLAGPPILVMIGLAPLVIQLLFSGEFASAAGQLRWQALATALKVASWPLGFVLLAAGAGRTYFFIESAVLLILAGATHWLLARHGLTAVGIAYLATYIVYLPLVYGLAVRRIGFRWSPPVRRAVVLLIALSVGLFALVPLSPSSVWPATLSALAIFASTSARRLHGLGLIRAIARKPK